MKTFDAFEVTLMVRYCGGRLKTPGNYIIKLNESEKPIVE